MTLSVEFAPGAGPLDVIGDHYLLVDGAGSASTPDHASLDIVGDIDIRCEVTLDDWLTPTNNTFVAKWNATSDQRSYMFWMFEGRLAFSWSTAGTLATVVTEMATVSVPVQSGRYAVRVATDVNSGGTANDVFFYTSDSISGTWTLLDFESNFGITSVFSSSAVLRVGNNDAVEDADPLIGRVHAAQVRSGIGGTIVANPDFTAQAVGATSFSDSASKTWTINSPASIAGFDWVNLSSRLLAATWTEGRDDELEHHGPGQATLVLQNDDRQLDPDYTAGTYFGELLPRVPFRIQEDDGGGPEDRFYGFVETGFEQRLFPPEVAECHVGLVDLLSAVAGLLPDVFEEALLDLAPVGLWSLDGTTAAEVVGDLTGNGHDGSVAGTISFGEPPVAAGHGESARFTASVEEGGYVHLGRSPLVDDVSAATVVATFKAASAASGNYRTLFVQGTGSLTGGKVIWLSIETTGKVHIITKRPGFAEAQYISADSVVDGEGHIVFGQSGGIAIDTATISVTTSAAGDFAAVNGAAIGGFTTQKVAATDYFNGWIGVVAVFDRQLNLTERTAIMEGYTKLAGQRSDEHIAWALDQIGIPAALRSLDEGTVYMGSAEAKGRGALEWIREVVDTEQGEFYVDHRDGGKLRFRNRYARFTDTRSTVAQAAFSDDPTNTTAARVERDGLDVAPNGMDGIVNQASVKWRDGEESVEDSASVLAYGPQSRSLTTQATSAQQARSAGEWLVARYANPRSRVRGATIRPDASDDALAAAQALRLGDRVTYRSHPQQVGSSTTVDLYIEGATHSFTDGVHRTAAYKLAPAHTFDPWIWGTSTWGETTVWG